ncbi:zinc finger CCCH domain-containing protein 7A isoform X2 [Ciona intestinalis]
MVKIFVGRLAPTVTAVQLRELFENYGTVSDCDILRDYGFVHMSSEVEAQKAITALDKYELVGSKLSVEMSTSRSMKSCQLTVKNLPRGTNPQDLHKLFKKFGTVTLCRISSDQAVVHMRFPSMATNAVRNLSGEIYRGNVLSVELANNNNRPPNNWPKTTPKEWKASDIFPVIKGSSENLENNSQDETNSIETKNEFMLSSESTVMVNGISNEHSVVETQAETTESIDNTLPTPITVAISTQSSVTAAPHGTGTVVSSTVQPTIDKAHEPREARKRRIQQGLKFLQSPMPWSGSAELYETFLNQLKEMMMHEGTELCREGLFKESVAQLNEAINICAYMKKEGINGYMDNFEKLLMERASVHLTSGNNSAALEDAEKAFNLSNGSNQVALRFKARCLVNCGRRNDALFLMLKFSQVATFDAESAQLCSILKQSMGNMNDEQSLGLSNNKGAIGDGRNRISSSFFPRNPMDGGTFNGSRGGWSMMNGSGDVHNGFLSSYSNFGNGSRSLLGAGIQSLQPNDSFSSPLGSQFQPYFNQNSNSSGFSGFSGNFLDNPVPGPITRPGQNLFTNTPYQAPQQKSSIFPQDVLYPMEQTNGLHRESSMPLPIGFRRPQVNSANSYPSSAGSPWNDTTNALSGINSAPTDRGCVDNTIDEELARGIEEELKTNLNHKVNSLTLTSNSKSLWPNSLNSDPGFQGNSTHNTSSYTHFPMNTSKSGFTGSFLGPAMLGISAGNQQQLPVSVSLLSHDTEVVTSTPSSVINNNHAAVETDQSNDSLSEILRNPLHDTHEFKLGCSDCVLRTGPRVTDFRHDENIVHSCYKNIVLCRRRGNKDWLKIRPRPQPQSKAQLYDGPYYICKDLMAGQDCTYPAVCTFAYNQEEIDVWTLERKGMLNRAWLCKSMDLNYVNKLSLVGLLICKHRGTFDFLCRSCFQNKPRIISMFSGNSNKCTNESSPHLNTEENQQLTHILRESSVRFTEIRFPIQQAILCRHAIRFQCTRGEDCHFAHSLVERDIWAIMEKEDLTAAEVVRQAQEHIKKQAAVNKESENSMLFSEGGDLGSFRWKVKFICSLCHKNGQVNEATKDMKYCTARAQHSWTTNKKVALVHTAKRWVQIRDLPYLKNKNLPVRFELCENFRRQKRCAFSGKCNFAHSQEEMDIWMYLRDNNLKDLEELYEALTKAKQAKLASKNQSFTTDASNIVLPTDTILHQSSYHCWLCDKECNGQRQWEHHCLSEKHKMRAISDSDGHWKFRKPGGNYKLCERHEKGVCEFDFLPASDNTCSFAHGKEELEEWVHRRQYVINRIRKAQDDHLIDAGDDMNNLINQAPDA